MASSAYAHRLKAGLGWTSPGVPVLVDATQLSPFAQPLPIPVKEPVGEGRHLDVDIAVGTHVSHPGLPPSSCWAYRTSASAAGAGPTRPVVLIANRHDPAHVTFYNRLQPDPPDGYGHQPPLLPPFIDLGLMMSGVAGHVGMDPYGAGTCSTHLHGAELGWRSDGHPVRVAGETTVIAGDEEQHALYPNHQLGTTLWFHDHVMGVTTSNVYAGLAGMYLLRAENEASLNLPGLDDPVDEFVHEMPLILSDRSFAADGRVIYGATFGALAPSDIDPRRPGHRFDQASEFKGDCVTVNGAVWPYLQVKPRRYRFRVVNAAASRFFRLVLRAEDSEQPLSAAPAALPITQIGGDGGFLPEGYTTDRDGTQGIVLAPGERADLVIDFTTCPDTRPVLRSEIFAESDNAGAFTTVLEGNGGDRTFETVPDGAADDTARPLPVARVMQFRVSTGPCDDDSVGSVRPDALTEITDGLTRLAADAADAVVRPLALDEQDRGAEPAQPEIVGPALTGPLSWYTPRTAPAEVVTDGDVEIWEFTNVSPDTHPIHLHLVQFRVLSRQNLPGNSGAPTAVGANEAGWKDTLRVGTGQITRFAVRFTNGEGRYVWHCHILEHEDMGMMRPLIVQQAAGQGGNT